MKLIKKLIDILYKPLFISYALYAIVTFLISVTESLDSKLFLSMVSYIPDTYYDVTYQIRYVIMTGFFIFLVLSTINYTRKIKIKFNLTCKSIDDFQREQGDEITKVILNLSLSDGTTPDDSQYDELSNSIYNFLCRFTTNICKVISSYTGKPCHVAIKTLNDDKITSWIREKSMSDYTRSSIDEALTSFDYEQNTAYKLILDMNNCNYYLNNWLRVSSFFRQYMNINPNWHKAYHATLVVPITLKTHPQRIDKEHVWGFICVDNMSGGFDKSSALIISSFARICFNVFENIPIVNHEYLFSARKGD